MTHNLEIFGFQKKQIKENFRFILIFFFACQPRFAQPWLRVKSVCSKPLPVPPFNIFISPNLILYFWFRIFYNFIYYYTLYRYTALQMKKQVRWKDRIWLVFPFKGRWNIMDCAWDAFFFFNPIILNISLHILLNHLGFKLCQQDNKSLPASIRKKSTLMDDALADPY